MSESILDSVKKLIGTPVDDTSFDADIILHINSVFMVLNQLGIGPVNGYTITDKTPKWSDYVAETANLQGLKTYMVLRVKALFDPSSTSFTQDAFQRQVAEFEWRLVLQRESGDFPLPPTP